jgi:hypothetical protein
MKNYGWWVLSCMMIAFAAPLGAEVNDNLTAISAAFNTGNSSEGLAVVRQTFATLNSGEAAQAETLIQSILAAAPMQLSGQVVVAAIEGSPALGSAVLSAISNTSQTEHLAILSRVSRSGSGTRELQLCIRVCPEVAKFRRCKRLDV